jgi:glutamate-1-semialdehyde 2,1-aminomutase
MLGNGLAMAPGAYEALFVGLGHTDEIIERIGDVTYTSARSAVREQ